LVSTKAHAAAAVNGRIERVVRPSAACPLDERVLGVIGQRGSTVTFAGAFG
jgi:hypothetical protein